jgi:hypothetical protein
MITRAAVKNDSHKYLDIILAFARVGITYFIQLLFFKALQGAKYAQFVVDYPFVSACTDTFRGKRNRPQQSFFPTVDAR